MGCDASKPTVSAPPTDGTAWVPRGPPLVLENPSKQASSVLIFLHGFFQSGSDMESLKALLDDVSGLRIVLPNSPATRDKRNRDTRNQIIEAVVGRQLGETAGSLAASIADKVASANVPSWMDDLDDLDPPVESAITDPRVQHSADLQSAIDYVHQLVNTHIANGIPSNRIWLGGNSQGGFIAYRAALTFSAGKLAGMVASATYPGEYEIFVAPEQSQLPLLILHGDADAVVPHALARKNEERLVGKVGRVVSVRIPGGGHTAPFSAAVDGTTEAGRKLREFLHDVPSTV